MRQQQRVKLRELNPNHDDTAFEGINVQINSLGPNLKNWASFSKNPNKLHVLDIEKAKTFHKNGVKPILNINFIILSMMKNFFIFQIKQKYNFKYSQTFMIYYWSTLNK